MPPCASSLGREAVELAASAGLILDPWQQMVLERSLGLREDGRWAAFQVGVSVPRQNGKGSIIEARELAGLFLVEERLIIHSAHLADTSLEAFNRLLALLESNPEFDRRVMKVNRSHGAEGVELRGRQRIRFRTRTSGGGRGFTADCLILDEAMVLTEDSHAAMLPTLSARPRPQALYFGSAVDEDVHEHGRVFAGLRARGLSGVDPALAWFEWSLEFPRPDLVPADVAASPASWRAANPAMDVRIGEEHVRNEWLAMTPRQFAVERLGVGAWPVLDDVGDVIAVADWLRLEDQGLVLSSPVFAVDVSPDRGFAAIAGAGRDADGGLVVEVLEHQAGTGWLIDRVRALAGRRARVAVDGTGPAASLVPELEAAKVRVQVMTGRQQADGCGVLFDAVKDGGLRFRDPGGSVAAGLRGATRRPLGDSWAWSRKSSSVDISPLVAVTLAVELVAVSPTRSGPRLVDLASV